jgi:O-antigen/teichoic acid export membrane protein
VTPLRRRSGPAEVPAEGGDLVRGVARNSAWAIAGTGVSAAALIAEVLILAHYLGPTRLGILLLVFAYPDAVQQLLDFRVRDAMTRYLTGFVTQGRNREAVAMVKLLWLLDVGVSAIALLIVILTASIAADLLVHDSGDARLMIIYSVGLFFGSLDTASGPVLRALDRFKLSFIGGSASSLARLGLVAGVVVTGGGLEAVVWARAGAEVATTVIQGGISLYVLARLLWKDRGAPVTLLRDQFGEITRFLVNTNLVGVLRLASSKLDTILVGLLASPATVAIYRIGIQFGRLPVLVADSLYTAIYPAFTRALAKGRIGDVRHIAYRVTVIMAALSVPVGIGLGLQSDALIGWLAGNAFRDSAPVFVVCLIGIIPYVVFFWTTPLMLAAGHAGPVLKIMTIATAAQLGAIVLLVPPFGATGAAVGLALAYILIVVLQLAFVHRRRLLARETLPVYTAPAARSTQELGTDLS